VEAPDVARATAAATTIGQALGLRVDDAVVLHNSNKLTLRLVPSDVVARVARVGCEVAEREVELSRRLVEIGCPVAALEPRVAPRVYEEDGYAVTLWTYFESATAPRVSPAAFAEALRRLHAGMRKVDVSTPHFTDRVGEAEALVASPELTPELGEADRVVLLGALADTRRAICDRGAAEQLLHGEPHPGNVLNTKLGPVFVDLETCCRGPVEFDLAHVPERVGACYPGVDQGLVDACRHLVLAMVAAWRWESGDQLPNGKRAGRLLLRALRDGRPWPTLDAVMSRSDP
jgi:hypothetical protein